MKPKKFKLQCIYTHTHVYMCIYIYIYMYIYPTYIHTYIHTHKQLRDHISIFQSLVSQNATLSITAIS